MPRRPDTMCKHPGCPRLVPYGNKYCDEHKSDAGCERKTSSQRGYDYKWQQARKIFLDTHPLCEECKKKGKYTKATVVDHVIAHRGNKELFWDRNNWMALCKPCHDKKTGTLDSHPEY